MAMRNTDGSQRTGKTQPQKEIQQSDMYQIICQMCPPKPKAFFQEGGCPKVK